MAGSVKPAFKHTDTCKWKPSDYMETKYLLRKQGPEKIVRKETIKLSNNLCSNYSATYTLNISQRQSQSLTKELNIDGV